MNICWVGGWDEDGDEIWIGKWTGRGSKINVISAPGRKDMQRGIAKKKRMRSARFGSV